MNVCAPEVPPPGVGLKTVIDALVATVRSDEGIVAAMLIAVTDVVASAVPFHWGTDELTKLVPVMVTAVLPLPGATSAGLMLEVVGMGLFPAVTVNVCAPEVPPPGEGLKTVIDALVATVRFPDGIVAAMLIAVTDVVASAVPFHWGTDELTKLVPVMVIAVLPLPATVEVGVRPEVVGTGLLDEDALVTITLISKPSDIVFGLLGSVVGKPAV